MLGLELCQLYKLMLKISWYSRALTENSTLNLATRSYRPSPSLVPHLSQLISFLSQISCFRRHYPPNCGLLIILLYDFYWSDVCSTSNASFQSIHCKTTSVGHPGLIQPPTPKGTPMCLDRHTIQMIRRTLTVHSAVCF